MRGLARTQGDIPNVAFTQDVCGSDNCNRTVIDGLRPRTRHPKERLAMAQTIAQAALTQCESMGFKVSVAVVDRGGLTIVMLRGDGAGLHTPEGAERKAYTARTFSQPSADFVKRLSDRPDTVGSRQYTRVLALGGGLPIKVGSEVVGAVGVSGSPGKGRRLLAGRHRQGRGST